MLNNKGKDVDIIDITPENYVVPKGEEDRYHVKIEVKKFDSETGKRLSRPRIQVFGKKAYEQSLKENLVRQGYTLIELHNPKSWIENQEKEKAENVQKAQEAKTKALEDKKAIEEQEKQKAIDDAVEKALAAQNANNNKKIADAVAKALAAQKQSEK